MKCLPGMRLWKVLLACTAVKFLILYLCCLFAKINPEGDDTKEVEGKFDRLDLKYDHFIIMP